MDVKMWIVNQFSRQMIPNFHPGMSSTNRESALNSHWNGGNIEFLEAFK